MISEVLLYQLMITCILVPVSSKEVKWTVRNTSPQLGQHLTLFCKVDNCTVNEIKRWHGGPDDKPLMSDSGLSTDKTKYNTAIEKHGFILTILHLTVKDLNVSYTCSCGFDIDKHILYIEDIYKVDNLNKSTNGNNSVGGISLYVPIISSVILVIVFVANKKYGLWRRLKEKINGIRRRISDEDNIQNVRDSLLPTMSTGDLYASSGATFDTGDTNIAICCGNKIYCNEGQDPLHEAFHNNCEYLRQITITSTQLKTACSLDQQQNQIHLKPGPWV